MSGLIWIQTVWHSEEIPERIFQKKLILKKISRRHKSMNDEVYVYILYLNCTCVCVFILVCTLICIIVLSARR